MKLRTLGELALEGHGMSRPKPLLLLAYLSLEGAKSRRFLAELFFADSVDPPDALSTTVRRLKKAGVVNINANSIGTTVESDAQQLLAALDAGAAAQAVQLYRGPFLGGLDLPLGAELEEWAFDSREFIAERVRGALLKMAEAELAGGNDQLAEQHARAAYELAGAAEPKPEVLIRLVRLLDAFETAGSGVAARIRQQARELGIEPPPTEAHSQALLSATAPAQLPLPSPPTTMIGRDEELIEIGRLLGTRECRLLTLHGPAGSGKSRLALQAASDLLLTGDFADGIVYVATETIAESQLLPTAISERAGSGDLGGPDPWSALADSVGHRQLLIVLDSFEHLIAAAPKLRWLLRTCPQLKLLVTSRQRLNLAEEHTLPIAGLKLPTDELVVEDALLSEALQLFLRRAHSTDVRFRLAATDLSAARRICRAVDGLPLGIELAAAWTRSLPLEALATSLETDLLTLAQRHVDGGSRHPSLLTALEHTWSQLSPQAQAVLPVLAVFRGGFRREAAAEVAGATIPLMMDLVDASVVHMDRAGRFHQHALLRQFARSRLGQLGDEAERVRARHAAYYASLLAAASTIKNSTDPHAAFVLLQEEEANFLASLEWAASNGDAQVLSTLAEPLLWYFPMTGRFATGSDVFARALAHLPSTASPALDEAAASLTLGQAWLARYAGNLAEAQQLSVAGERLARSAHSPLQLVRALDLRGQALTYEGRFAEAHALLQEGVTVARQLGDPLRLIRILCNLALLDALTGRLTSATALLEEALEPFEQHTVPVGFDTVAVLLAQGVTCLCSLDPRAAVQVLDEALELAKALSYLGPVPTLKALLAQALVDSSGDSEAGAALARAGALIAAGLAMVERSQEAMATSLLHGAAAGLALRQGHYDHAVQHGRTAYHVAQAAGNQVIKLWSLPRLMAAYAAQGDAQRALRIGAVVTAQQASPQWLRQTVASIEPKLRLGPIRQPRQNGDTQRKQWESSDLAELVGVPG